MVVDESTAKKESFEVGEVVGVQAEGNIEKLRISGLVRFGAVESIGGATLTGFDRATAQRIFGKEGKLDQIRIAGEEGVSPDALLAAIERILPDGTQVRTGDQQAVEDASETNEFISFLQKFLLAFAGVALFVGSFVIANSLSITIAQRTREFATLRTLGASRRQVLESIVLESLVVGAVASAVGLFLGLGLATGLFELFDAVGFTLPNSGLVFYTAHDRRGARRGHPRHGRREPPAGAPCDPGAADRGGAGGGHAPGGSLRALPHAGIDPAHLARLRLLLWGLFGAEGTTPILLFMLVGALVIFFGVALFSVRLVQPLSRALSPVARWVVTVFTALAWPLWLVPYWLLRHGSSARARSAAA